MHDDDDASGSRHGKAKRKRGTKGVSRDHLDQSASAFAEILTRKFTVQLNGTDREFTLAEALLHKLLQQALAGNKAAIRTVLERIQKRDAAIVPAGRNVPVLLFEHKSPQPVDDAMLILGIASDWPDRSRTDGIAALRLEPWVVSSCLARGRPRLNEQAIKPLKLHTRDPDLVAWHQGEDE